jgi:hypothetical protein
LIPAPKEPLPKPSSSEQHIAAALRQIGVAVRSRAVEGRVCLRAPAVTARHSLGRGGIGSPGAAGLGVGKELGCGSLDSLRGSPHTGDQGAHSQDARCQRWSWGPSPVIRCWSSPYPAGNGRTGFPSSLCGTAHVIRSDPSPHHVTDADSDAAATGRSTTHEKGRRSMKQLAWFISVTITLLLLLSGSVTISPPEWIVSVSAAVEVWTSTQPQRTNSKPYRVSENPMPPRSSRPPVQAKG